VERRVHLGHGQGQGGLVRPLHSLQRP